MKIVQRMFDIMQQKNIQSKDLAGYLRISKSVVSAWKTRGSNPPAEYIVQICGFLEISVAYLLTGIDDSQSRLNPPSSPESPISSEEKKVLERYHQLDDLEQEYILGKMAKLIMEKKTEDEEEDEEANMVLSAIRSNSKNRA